MNQEKYQNILYKGGQKSLKLQIGVRLFISTMRDIQPRRVSKDVFAGCARLINQ